MRTSPSCAALPHRACCTFIFLSGDALQPLAYVLSTTGAFAGLGAVYLGTETLLRNNRDKDDVWNRVIAGSLAGSLVGLRNGSLYASGGAAASIAFGTFILHLCNGKIGSMYEEQVLKDHSAIYTE